MCIYPFMVRVVRRHYSKIQDNLSSSCYLFIQWNCCLAKPFAHKHWGSPSDLASWLTHSNGERRKIAPFDSLPSNLSPTSAAWQESRVTLFWDWVKGLFICPDETIQIQRLTSFAKFGICHKNVCQLLANAVIALKFWTLAKTEGGHWIIWTVQKIKNWNIL